MSNKNPGDIAFDIDKSLDVVSKEYRTVSGIAALVEVDMIKNGREVRIVNSPDEAKEIHCSS